MCDRCQKPIAAYDLIPLASFLALRGKCRQCGEMIGIGAFAIETSAALIGLISSIALPPEQAVAAAIFGWLLLPLAILDCRHLWLPNVLLLWLAVVGVIAGPLLPLLIGWTDRIIGAAAGFASLEALRLAYRQWRKTDGMGAGDPKLFAVLGLWLGWALLPMTLLLASGIGLLHVVGTRLRARAEPKHLPLGSYLACAALLLAWSSGLAS